MAKYVFLNLPMYGHVNPTLALAQELVSRGQEVSYYLTEEFRGAVQATGATFQPYESKINGHTSHAAPAQSNLSPVVRAGLELVEEASAVVPQVIERIRAEKPAAIIYDFMCIWAQEVSETLQVPAISTRATYASNEHFNLFEQIRKSQEMVSGQAEPFEERRGEMEELMRAYPQQQRAFFGMFSRVEALNIIFFPREFQPAGETFDERYLFVGPPISVRHDTTSFPFDQLRSQQPLLYIALGSMISDRLDFYQKCFEAFGEQAWQVVLSIGKGTDPAELGPIPANFLLSGYVPQLELLSRARAFVTHAGANSVMESLYFGVPMVLIPHQPEQDLNAQRAVELGAGLLLDKETLTAAALREAVECIAQDGAQREAAQRMQQFTRAAGGQQRAAEAIIQFVEMQSGRESLTL